MKKQRKKLYLFFSIIIFLTACGSSKLNISGANAEQKQKIQDILDENKIYVKSCKKTNFTEKEQIELEKDYYFYDLVDNSNKEYRMMLLKKDYTVIIISNIADEKIVYNNLTAAIGDMFNSSDLFNSDYSSDKANNQNSNEAGIGAGNAFHAETIHQLGEKVTLGDWEVIIKSVYTSKSVKDELLISSADTENVFLVLNLYIKNNGTNSKCFTSIESGVNITAIYKDKYNYESSITMIDRDASNVRVKPLSRATVFVVIEIPQDIQDDIQNFKIEFEDNNNVKQWIIDKKSSESNNKNEDNSESSNKESNVFSGDYIFPNSDKRKLEDTEVGNLAEELLPYARNEIFARHGRAFIAKKYKDYFTSKSWYKVNPKYSTDDQMLNEIEKYNVELILDWEWMYNEYEWD